MSTINQEELPDRYYIQKDPTRKLGAALKELAREVSLTKAFRHREILGIWRDIIGEESCKHTHVAELKKGYLLVEVNSAALLHHLTNFCKEDILRELQTRYKNTFITDVRFKLSTEG